MHLIDIFCHVASKMRPALLGGHSLELEVAALQAAFCRDLTFPLLGPPVTHDAERLSWVHLVCIWPATVAEGVRRDPSVTGLRVVARFIPICVIEHIVAVFVKLALLKLDCNAELFK